MSGIKHTANKYSNRNENLITAEEADAVELYLKDFEYKNFFRFLCRLRPNPEEEKLEITDEVNEEKFNTDKMSGLVYLFVMNGKILKVGSTITPFVKRVQSYNTGKTRYRISGKNSTTNYFCLQSFLKINKTIDVYAFFPEKATADVFGEVRDVEPNPKHWEREILAKLIRKDSKPIFRRQR